jgi:hypothetical protein
VVGRDDALVGALRQFLEFFRKPIPGDGKSVQRR